MQVVVLSSHSARARSFAESARGEGRSIVHASSLAEFKSLRSAYGESVVLLDLKHFNAAVPEVLDAASRFGSPSLVIAPDFDSAQWIHLFQLGVCDVLRDPVSTGELHRSIEAAFRSIPVAKLKSGGSWYNRAWNWGRNVFGF